MDSKIINPNTNNYATGDDRVANIVAGREALAAMGKKKVSRSFSTQDLKFWERGRKQHYASNPIVPGVADYVMWDYYDDITFAAGAAVPTNFKLFVLPIGQGGKTKANTNLEQVSSLPSPYVFNVTHLGFKFNENINPIDIDAFVAQSYFEFWVNNKVYIEGKFNRFPAGGGIVMSSTQTSVSQVNNGWAVAGNMYDLRLPGGLNLGNIVADGFTGIYILQQQNFKIEVNLPGGALNLTASDATPNPGKGLLLEVYAYGILSRSVQ